MLYLYAIFLGGRAKKCNTELHDVVFAIGKSLEEVYPLLVNKWFGLTKFLHIDAYIKLSQVEGYDIIISREKLYHNDLALYFVNLGGYKKGYFGELHESGFFVALSKSEALVKAKKQLCLSSILVHCDDNKSIQNLMQSCSETEPDDIFVLKTLDRYYIQLVPSQKIKPIEVKNLYQKLDLPDIVNKARKQIRKNN